MVGFWSLHVLGDRALNLAPHRARLTRQTIQRAFFLRHGAKQGRPLWYLLHLEYRIVFAPDSGAGSIYLSASTNNATSAQIRFDVKRGPSGQLSISSDSLGLVDGHVVTKSSRRMWRGNFDNYMQYAGVRSGWNSLTLQVEQYGAAHVTLASIMDTSGIQIERGSPPRLGLQTHLVPPSLTLHRPARIDVLVKNVGGMATRPGTIGLVSTEGFRTHGPRQLAIPALQQNAQTRRVFLIEPTKPGRISISILARAGLSFPMNTVVAQVVAKKETYLRTIGTALAAVLAILITAMYLRRGLRSSTEQRVGRGDGE
jgi:hypothetical protein